MVDDAGVGLACLGINGKLGPTKLRLEGKYLGLKLRDFVVSPGQPHNYGTRI